MSGAKRGRRQAMNRHRHRFGVRHALISRNRRRSGRDAKTPVKGTLAHHLKVYLIKAY